MQVEADWSELAADYEDIVSAYLNVRLPGFRPGRVPRRVIEGRFQKEIIEDFSQRVAQRLGREVLRQANIMTIGPVKLRDIECGKEKPFRFTACYRPMPEVNLPELGSLAAGDDKSDPRDLISGRLLEMVSFSVPDALVSAELGQDEAICVKGSDGWKDAEDRVRLILILKKIAGREGIEVSDADVEQRIREKASEFNKEADLLRAELQKGGGWQRLKDMLLVESTLDYLVEKTGK